MILCRKKHKKKENLHEKTAIYRQKTGPEHKIKHPEPDF